MNRFLHWVTAAALLAAIPASGAHARGAGPPGSGIQGWIDKIDDSNGTRRAVRRSAKGNPLPWELHTAAMLWARAVTTLGTRLFPDTTMGWFTRLEEPAEEI